MKKLILVLILMFSTNAFSQTFSLQTEIGQGLQWKTDLTRYQTTISVAPQMGIDSLFWSGGRLVIAALTESYLIDSTTTWSAGSRVMYRVKNNENYGLYITGKALFGEAGNQWFGGGLMTEFKKWTLGLEAAYNPKDESYRGQFTLGTYIF